MTKNVDEMLTADLAKARPPGYLLTPFGWAAPQIVALAAAEPAAIPALLDLDQRRLHLIALALAHLAEPISTELGWLLVRGSLPEILDRVLGLRPRGIRRALGRLPSEVLQPQSYRQLVELFQDEASGKLLFHADDIDDASIQLLYAVPPALRRPVLRAAAGCLHRLDGLADGLRFLASRGAAPSFDALVADLASAQQPSQFVARLRQMTERLALPQTIPPARVGLGRRLDTTAEIRCLAKRWHNCLAIYVKSVDAGQCVIYLWPQPLAACLVRRRGRLGWFLEEPMGPNNVELEPDRSVAILKAFADSGVPRDSAANAIESILQSE